MLKKSSIVVYQDCKIIESENYILDSIELYLASLSSQSFAQSQYIKHGLDITANIQYNAFEVNTGSNIRNFNYCKITTIETNTITEQSREYTCYYFVRKVTELADSTVQLSLHMDVINTYKAGAGFAISPRTIIKREHKNRYIKLLGDTKWYARNIDFYPEGINPQLYQDNAPLQLEDSVSAVAKNFYLIYRNSLEDSADVNNVVECYLATDVSIQYSFTPLSPIILPNQLVDGRWYYLFADSSSYTATTYDNQPVSQLGLMTRFQKVGNYILLEQCIYPSGMPYIFIPPYDNLPFDSINSYLCNSITLQTNDKYYYSSVKYDGRRDAYENSQEQTATIGTITGSSLAFKDYNRTDSRIIKIIKLPYAPTSGFELDNSNHIIFDSTIWEYDEIQRLLHLKNLNADFLNDSIAVDDKFGFGGNLGGFASPALKDLRSVNPNDPKVFHSEFYKVKYVYDSFACEINPEYCYIDNTAIDIYFRMTTTINSRFMFDLSEFDLTIANQDFPTTLVVQRNNDMVIYNSPYINYLRAGYNYDVKAKNRTEAMSWFTTGLGITAGALNVAFGSKILGVGMIASSIASLGNAINTTLSAEQNFNRNIEALKWQSNSVAGADDVDLMSDYAHNKLLRFIYAVSPRMKALLNDLFFLTGYIENRMGIPDVQTRSWFNFLACDLKFEEVNNITKECLEEIVMKYQGGVTFLHPHKLLPTDSHPYYDFERKYANWENVMLE